ncbi:MAG: FliH/SctL family protein [bacterium]
MAVRILKGDWHPSPEEVEVIAPSLIKVDSSQEQYIRKQIEEAISREKSRWYEEAERKLHQEVKLAYQKGFEQGLSQLEQMMEPLRKRWDELLTSISQSWDSVWDAIQENLPKLAIYIARRVVHKTAQDHGQLAQELAQRLIEQVKDQTKVTIFVNPEDLEVVNKIRDHLKISAERVIELDIAPRSALKPGSVEINTDLGALIADPEDYLARVSKALGNGGDIHQ